MNALVHGSRSNEETLQGLAMLYAVLVYGCKLENKIPETHHHILQTQGRIQHWMTAAGSPMVLS